MTTTFGLAEKVSAGQSLTLQGTGDSTVFGAYDTENKNGWLGRLGLKFGLAFNTTVQSQQYGVTGVYSAAVTLNTGAGVNRILVRDAGMQGWTTANVNGALSTMLSIANPDLIIHGTGFNDINQTYTPAQFVANIHTFITRAKVYCPGVPIIITTENVANSSAYDAAFNLLANDLVGQSLPITPALQASTTISGVWFMDTRQAYNNVWQSALMTDSLHPRPAGYQAQADWMYDLLVAGFGGPAGVAPTVITSTLDAMTQGSVFSQTLSVVGTDPITWTVVGGLPPSGLSLDSTGILSGTPTAPNAYDFTVRATNSFGSDDQRYTGTVAAQPAAPFIPDGVTRFFQRRSGLWCPVGVKLRVTD